MFNQKTLDILSQVNGITNSIILKYPETVGISEGKDVMVLINMEDLDSDKFDDMGLINLSDFLNNFKLFPEDREISFKDSVMNIKSGKMNSTFITDNLVLMNSYDKDPSQFTKTEEVPSVATFELTAEDIKSFKSATSVFKTLGEVIINSQDSDITLSLGNTNKFNQNSNRFNVTKSDVVTSKEFEIKIPVENFKMIPGSDYTVDVKYNEARDNYRIIMCNKVLKGFKIILSVKI